MKIELARLCSGSRHRLTSVDNRLERGACCGARPEA
jgi:hypothetical protein